jgi:hypothetical protein
MRVGTIVRNNRLGHPRELSQVGVVTTVAGSPGHAGFKFVAWERTDGRMERKGDYTDFYIVQTSRNLNSKERETVARIKANLRWLNGG